jgi:ferritin-like metal-binding protein YciE
LVTEAQEAVAGAQTDTLRDCAIVSSVAKVERNEIGSYRTLVSGAQLRGQSEVEQLLRNNMDQEQETARIAEGSSEKLLREAMEQEGRHPEGEGFVEKAKEKLISR